MANITRIKAKDPSKPQPKKVEKPVEKVENTPKPIKKEKTKKEKKPFILFRPFLALGRYLRDSWREIRQVRWPNRKATWKMVLAVFIYAAIFLVLIIALDALFTYLFNLILS
ncbi:preprotein translocase subunit SecE [Candidatus Saccharibacteria bacterium]|nr:preprotein translocase subunit SecE [Candidatus Saccharibacteria bacterium]